MYLPNIDFTSVAGVSFHYLLHAAAPAALKSYWPGQIGQDEDVTLVPARLACKDASRIAGVQGS
jgi:hypothetical protein